MKKIFKEKQHLNTNYKINLVNNTEKLSKIKFVNPNIIHNRFDIKYDGDFSLLEVIYNEQTLYVPCHISDGECFIGVYMMDLDRFIFDKILEFIGKNSNTKIYKYHCIQLKFEHEKLYTGCHWLLSLPPTFEEFMQRFSSKTRYNRAREKKLLENSFNCEYIYYSKEQLTKELMETFLKLKNSMCVSKYAEKNQAEKLLSNFYHITDVYGIKINNKIAAIILYSAVDKESLYCENMSYDTQYAKYFIGNILYYYSIKELISKGFKNIYLGGGEHKYKENSKAVKTITSAGTIEKFSFKNSFKNFLKFIFSIRNENYKTVKCITILGLKIRIKKNKVHSNI